MRTLFDLCKFRISFLAALSSAAGFLLARGTWSWTIMAPAAGVLLIACGAGALNQVQERRADALMERTRSRPLPNGRITPTQGVLIAAVSGLAGFFILFSFGRLLIPGLGLFAVLWYNGLYTWLKTKSPWAAVPGALTGAVPPVIGWSAAGGVLPDPQIMIVAFFFFIWQVPHFWLILLNHPGDYEKAGFPSLSHLFSAKQLARMTFVWICAAAVASILLPLFGVIRVHLVYLLLLFGSFRLIWQSGKIILKGSGMSACRFSFKAVNLYALWILALISFDRLFFPLL